MDSAILIALITAVPTTATAVSTVYLNSKRKKDRDEAEQRARRDAAKNSILNMMTQDIIYSEILKKTPENHQAILKEFDEYTKNGGNSWLKEKVQIYMKWYDKNY